MKKLILSVAILAVAASCSKNEVTDVAPSQQSQIGFGTLNDKVTSKAANDATANYQVYAKTSTGTGWLIDDVVTGADNTAQNGPYYWPTTAGETVDFYAYAPASAGIESLAEAYDADVTFSYTVPTGAQEDFTVATPLLGYTSELKGDGQTASNGTADFTFSHMLSKITVEVVLAEEGDYALNNYEIDDEAWAADISVYQTTSAVNVTTGTSTAYTTDDLALTKYEDKRVYYITPQDTENCTIQLTDIKIKHTTSGSYLYGSADAGIALKAITLSAAAMNGGEFEQGKHYKITITVGGDATPDGGEAPVVIKFTAEDEGWGDGGTQGLTQG